MTMAPIIPTLKLHTYQDADSTSIQFNSLIVAYNGNHYHLEGGTGDTIHVFTQSIAIYVLTTNKGHGRMALNAYMVPHPDPINGVYMHTPQDIEDLLGTNWEQLSALDLTLKLIDYLM